MTYNVLMGTLNPTHSLTHSYQPSFLFSRPYDDPIRWHIAGSTPHVDLLANLAQDLVLLLHHDGVS